MLAVALMLFHVIAVYVGSTMLIIYGLLYDDWVVAALAFLFHSMFTICLLWSVGSREE